MHTALELMNVRVWSSTIASIYDSVYWAPHHRTPVAIVDL